MSLRMSEVRMGLYNITESRTHKVTVSSEVLAHRHVISETSYCRDLHSDKQLQRCRSAPSKSGHSQQSHCLISGALLHQTYRDLARSAGTFNLWSIGHLRLCDNPAYWEYWGKNSFIWLDFLWSRRKNELYDSTSAVLVYIHCHCDIWALKSNQFIFESKWQLVTIWKNPLEADLRFVQEAINMFCDFDLWPPEYNQCISES